MKNPDRLIVEVTAQFAFGIARLFSQLHASPVEQPDTRKRQHLTESQRAAIAADIANMQHGGDRKSEKIKHSIDGLISTKEAAEHLNVGTRSVETAKSVKLSFPQAWEHIKSGNITVADARKVKIDISQSVVYLVDFCIQTVSRVNKL